MVMRQSSYGIRNRHKTRREARSKPLPPSLPRPGLAHDGLGILDGNLDIGKTSCGAHRLDPHPIRSSNDSPSPKSSSSLICASLPPPPKPSKDVDQGSIADDD
jgi:hypothetical protein